MTLLETRPTPWHQAKAFWWNSGSEASRRSSFPPKYIFPCSPENPLLPLGTLRTFLFESFFPFVLSLFSFWVKRSQVLEQTFEDTKAPFYSSLLKNNFLCHLFGLLFLGRQFPPQPGLDGPSLLQRSRPATYKCLKKEPPSLQSKTTSKLGRVKGQTQ